MWTSELFSHPMAAAHVHFEIELPGKGHVTIVTSQQALVARPGMSLVLHLRGKTLVALLAP
jgi:hypothetical protein